MCSIIGVGEGLHKVLGQIDLGTLDSGERSLPFGLLVNHILSNLLVTRTGIKSQTSSNSGQIGSVTSELHALQGELYFE